MQTLRLSTLDLAIVAAYLVTVTVVGLWASRGVRSGREFFLAGRSLPWWAAGMSLVVSDIGAKDMIGLAGDAYRYGIVMMNFDFIGCTLPVLFAAFVFMPFFWLAGVYTVPEYLGRRYCPLLRTLFALIWAAFMVGTLGTIFVSAASMFEGLVGWSFWWSVGFTAIVAGLYAAAGGLKAVVATEVVSCLVLATGAALLCVLGVARVGGFGSLATAVAGYSWTSEHLRLLPSAVHPVYPWPAVVLGLGFVLGPAYWIGNQAIIQRSLGTRTPAEARASYVMCAAIKLVFPLLLVLPGLIALALFGQELGEPSAGWDANRVLPLVVVRIVPSGALGLLIGAFVAGVLSNLESYVNSASTLLVSDLYRPYVDPGASDTRCVAVGRVLVGGLLVLGALVSYAVKTRFGSVFEAFQTFLSLFQGALFALLLFGMLTRRASPAGGVAGLLVGVGAAAVLTAAGVLYLWVAWWSFVAATAGIVFVSVFTAPKPDRELCDLVFSLPGRTGGLAREGS